MRVGFLLLGPQTHVHHCASIAFELAALPGFAVTLLVSSRMNADSVTELAVSHNSPCTIEWLHPPWGHRVMRAFKKRLHPRASAVVAHNRERLSEFDVLVTPDDKPVRTAAPQPRLVFVPHGMGDRPAGFTARMRGFDFMLLPGPKTQRRMEALGFVAPGHSAIIGSPKFDFIRFDQPSQMPAFAERRPVVLYNPHFNPEESSWPLWGRQVLDYFLASPDFNLIFAPHMLLLSRRRRTLPQRFLQAPNILVDTASPALSDMTYTRAADIYLGDASSQVYEFVACRHRPCLFLNPRRVAWQGVEDFTMWRMGPVLDDLGGLDANLRSAGETFARYLPEQKALLRDTLALPVQGAGRRGALALAQWLRQDLAADIGTPSGGLAPLQQE